MIAPGIALAQLYEVYHVLMCVYPSSKHSFELVKECKTDSQCEGVVEVILTF